MKVQIKQVHTPTLIGVKRTAIDTRRSDFTALRSVTYIAKWERARILLPNKTWLDRQTLHYEEPYGF